MPTPARVLLTTALLTGSIVSGCIVDGPPKPEPPKTRPAPRETASPTKVTVSPLTRVAFESGAGPSILLHLDFRDATDRSIKAYGRVHVELYQPTPGSAAGGDPKSQTIASSWDADLRDSVRNALTFDEMITRTYTIPLSGIPDWLARWARREGDQANAAAPTIVVQFANGDSTDSAAVLRAVHVLTR